MKCRFVEIEQPNDKGWRRVRCRCCGLTTNPTPSKLERIHANCRCFAVGDCLASVLAVCGITKPRYTAMLLWLGVLKPKEKCRCAKRQEAINEAGVAAQGWLGRLLG